MMTKKLHRGIRLEPVLNARCEAAAADVGLNFSEWVREVLRREVGLKRPNGKKRAA